MSKPEPESDIVALHGETMALQFVIGGLMQGLIRNGQAEIVKGALDYAEILIEIAAQKQGRTGNMAHTAKMMSVVDALRKSTSG